MTREANVILYLDVVESIVMIHSGGAAREAPIDKAYEEIKDYLAHVA